MRKYGKYEKRPEVVPAKQPNATSMLLQTYFMSLLCMVLCVTMFFGTSYAWFTSEASYGANEIYVGTLNVGLYKGEQKLAANDKLFDGDPWEPDQTRSVTIQVKNEGTMAFKYELSFTDGHLVDRSNTALAAVAEQFEVWVYNGTPTDVTYAGITAENSKWTKAGTLADLLAGKKVLEDKELDAAAAADNEKPAHTYTIALHMNETAAASVMGQKITFNVKLVAYQLGMPTADGAAGQEDANA